MNISNHKEFFKLLEKKQIDKKTCIDYFLKISKERSYISFSQKMVIGLFRYNHEYIFKFLFDQGILYSTHIDNITMIRLSKKAIQSEAFVYAINFPAFLLRNKLKISPEYSKEQLITLEHINLIYYSIKKNNVRGIQHPYSIYCFFKDVSITNLIQKEIPLSKQQFIEKINNSKQNINSIKNYIFDFYESKLTNKQISAFLDYLNYNNLMSFKKIDPKLLFHKGYHNYIINHSFKLKSFHFSSDFIETTFEPLKTSQRILELLDTSESNSNYIFSNFLTIYVNLSRFNNFTQNSLKYSFFKQLLINFFIVNEHRFKELFNKFQSYIKCEHIFIDLYDDIKFQNIFNKHLDHLSIHLDLINDFLNLRKNISNF